METYGLKDHTATCYLCGQELPVENSSPFILKTIDDNGKTKKALTFLCGTCDKRGRQ